MSCSCPKGTSRNNDEAPQCRSAGILACVTQPKSILNFQLKIFNFQFQLPKELRRCDSFSSSCSQTPFGNTLKGAYDRAIADYNQAIELKPDYDGAYANRGIALLEKKERAAAISDFRKAFESSKDPSLIYAMREKLRLLGVEAQ